MSFWCRIGFHAWQTLTFEICYPARSWKRERCEECGVERVHRL